MDVQTYGSQTVIALDAEGTFLAGEDDALKVVGETHGMGADWVAIPATRLAPEFFVLSSKQAGGFFQKLMNYQLKVAIVGDISGHTDESAALRDFVAECNRGHHIRFVGSMEDLAASVA